MDKPHCNPTMDTPGNLATLLESLQHRSAQPLSSARAMPPGVYTSEAFHERELDRIFAKEWLCAGRADALAKTGDYLTCQIGTQPVFVVRGADNTIRAFANACLHRMMQLLDGNGRCKTIVCPYHAWVYDLEGRLKRTRHMERSEGFDHTTQRLPEIRTEIWEGWIFVTLSPDIKSVAHRLKSLRPIVKDYAMRNYIEVFQEDHEWDTNWKTLTENFMEGYHLPIVHRATVGAYFPVEDTKFSAEPANDAFTVQWFLKTSDTPIGKAHPRNRRLKGKARNTSIQVSIFPCHMFILAPDHFWYLSLHPNGTGKVRIRFGIALAPEVLKAAEDPEALVRETAEYLWRVNEEDKAVVEAVYRNAQAPLSNPGQLSWLEQNVHDFIQYIIGKTADP